MRLRSHRLNLSICLAVLLALTACSAPATTAPVVQSTGQPDPALTEAISGQPDETQPAGDQASTQAPALSTREVLITVDPLEVNPLPTMDAPVTVNPLEVAPLPTLAPSPTGPVTPQLAFLHDGDIWLLDDPAGQAYQLTLAGDILSYAWAPDGERLAAFNGRSLCFFQRDGSIRTACLELGLTDEQAEVERRIVWSPNQRWIVLWNPVNPQDEDAIGWLIVALDTTNAMWRIQDPVDWGAELAPNNEAGGFTGQPVFRSDSTLLGTLSHRYLCGSGGCRYQLYEFDLAALAPSFSAYPNQPEEGWSEGRSLILSPDGQGLTNYGAFLFGCDSFHTFVDRFNLSTETRAAFSLDQQAVDSLAFNPDESLAVLARTAGCSPAETEAWSQTCGLSSGAEVLPMQRWEPAGGDTEDLPPGLAPAWSPDGEWLAFRSCLAEDGGDEWQVDPNTPASIYLMDAMGKVTLIAAGDQPAWRPR